MRGFLRGGECTSVDYSSNSNSGWASFLAQANTVSSYFPVEDVTLSRIATEDLACRLRDMLGRELVEDSFGVPCDAHVHGTRDVHACLDNDRTSNGAGGDGSATLNSYDESEHAHAT